MRRTKAIIEAELASVRKGYEMLKRLTEEHHGKDGELLLADVERLSGVNRDLNGNLTQAHQLLASKEMELARVAQAMRLSQDRVELLKRVIGAAEFQPGCWWLDVLLSMQAQAFVACEENAAATRPAAG